MGIKLSIPLPLINSLTAVRPEIAINLNHPLCRVHVGEADDRREFEKKLDESRKEREVRNAAYERIRQLFVERQLYVLQLQHERDQLIAAIRSSAYGQQASISGAHVRPISEIIEEHKAREARCSRKGTRSPDQGSSPK